MLAQLCQTRDLRPGKHDGSWAASCILGSLLHDAAQEPSCLPSYAKLEIYARAAARDSSIATPAGGCGAVHVSAAAPELTLITSAMLYHSRKSWPTCF